MEVVLLAILDAIRPILCHTTNTTPHERIFSYTHRSASGHSLVTSLAAPGSVLLRRNVRANKYGPLDDEVQLLKANHHYVYLRFNDGRESIVSVNDLAPVGKKYDQRKPKNKEQDTVMGKGATEVEKAESHIHSKPFSKPEINLSVPSDSENQYFTQIPEDSVTLRRSSRNRKKALQHPKHFKKRMVVGKNVININFS